MEARRVGREDHERDAAKAGAARPDRHGQEVGAGAVGDPELLPVDDVVVAIAPRRGLDVRYIRAGARLADRQCGNLVARDGRSQELPLDLVAADLIENRRRHVALNHQAQVHAGVVGVVELLRVGHGVPPVEPHAAVGRVHADAEQTQIGCLLEDFAREDARLVPLFGMRCQTLRELSDGAPEGLVVIGKDLVVLHEDGSFGHDGLLR